MMSATSKAASARGFTFVELMVVVAIIGILVAIAVPAYSNYITRARLVEALSIAEPIQVDVARFYDRWGVFPADNAAAGLPDSRQYIGQIVRGLRVQDGAIIVELDTERLRLGEQTQAAMVLRPLLNAQYATGPIAWLCNDGKVPSDFQIAAVPNFDVSQFPHSRFLPSGCRK